MSARGSDRLMLIGRLKPGVTAGAAQPALKGLAANLETAFPVEQKDQTFMTAPLNKFGTSTAPVENDPVPTIGALLSAMAGVVLLVACLNLRSGSRSAAAASASSGSFSPKDSCSRFSAEFADCFSAFGLPTCSSPRSVKFCRWMLFG